MSARTGDDQAAARRAGQAGGDMTAAELRAVNRQADEARQKQQASQEAKLFAADEFRRAQAEAKAEGRTVTSQTLRINLESGRVKGKTVSVDSNSFRRSQNQTPIPEKRLPSQTDYDYSKLKNSSSGEADFGYGTPLKGAPGRIQEVGQQGNINTTKFERVETRGPTNYSVEINDSLSGYIPGKTHFKVNLKDSISNKGYEPKPVEKKEAKGGFVEGLGGYAKNTADDFDLGFFGSGVGIGALIKGATGGKTSKAQMDRISIRGAEAESRTEREFEREFVGAGFNVGAKAIQGKSSDGKEFESLGKDIGKNPTYFAGSAFGTALSFAGPGGIRKVASGITKGIGGVGIKGAATTSKKVATQTVKEFDIKDKGDITVQAFKTGKKGEEIPLSQKGGMYVESKVRSIPVQSKRLGIGETFTIPGTSTAVKLPEKIAFKTSKVTTPDYFMINKGVDDVGSFSLKTGKGAVTQGGLSLGEKELLVGQKIIPSKKIQGIGFGLDIASPTTEKMRGVRAPASGIVDVFQNESKVLPKIAPPSIKGKPAPSFESPIVKSSEGIGLAKSRPVGFSIAEFSTKKMLDFESYGRKSALNKSELGLFGPQKTKYSPFQFAAAEKPKLTQSSRTPLETQSEFDFDRTIMRSALKDIVTSGGSSTRESTKTSNIASGLGFGGNAKNYTAQGPLGFGGATGAERMRSKVKEDEDYGIGYDFLQTPKGKGISRVDSKTFANPLQGSRQSGASSSKSDFTSKADSLSGLKIDNFSLLGSRSKTTSKSDLFSVPKSDNSQIARSMSSEIFDFGQKTETSQTTRTTNTFRFDTPATTRTSDPSRPFAGFDIPDFGGKKERKGKKGKKGTSQKRTFKTTDPLSAVLGPKSKLGRKVQKYSDMFS